MGIDLPTIAPNLLVSDTFNLNIDPLPKEKEIVQGTLLDDRQLYYVYFLLKHFNHLNEIFHHYNLHTHLTELGCRAAIEMVGHFNDGSIVNLYLKDLSLEFIAVQRRLGLNQL